MSAILIGSKKKKADQNTNTHKKQKQISTAQRIKRRYNTVNYPFMISLRSNGFKHYAEMYLKCSKFKLEIIESVSLKLDFKWEKTEN